MFQRVCVLVHAVLNLIARVALEKGLRKTTESVSIDTKETHKRIRECVQLMASLRLTGLAEAVWVLTYPPQWGLVPPGPTPHSSLPAIKQVPVGPTTAAAAWTAFQV